MTAKTIMTSGDIDRSLDRISLEIIERNRGLDELSIIGVHTGGVFLAQRLKERLEARGHGIILPSGNLDITLYRDDLSFTREQPLVRRTHIPGGVQGRNIYLVDDVVYTGRTTRAALDAVMDLGRAACIRLAVLIDRGQRELPINPDIVGKQIPTSKAEVIQVKVKEIDGKDMVILSERHN